MIKGQYPAEEYYSFKPEPDSKRKTERKELSELFLSRVNYISNLWKEINGEDVLKMSPDDFDEKKEKISSGLNELTEDYQSKKKEIVDIKNNILTLADSIKEEQIKKNNDGKNYANQDKLNLFENKLKGFKDRLLEKIRDSDYEFIYYVTNFLNNLSKKKHIVESLKSEDAQSFLDKLNNVEDYGLSSIKNNIFVKRLVSIIQKRIEQGDNTLDLVEFGSFDVIFNFNRFDFVNGFMGDEFSEIRIARGLQVTNTPIIIIVRDTDFDAGVIDHERGHNLIECSENEKIHTAIYTKYFIEKLEEEKINYNKTLDPKPIENHINNMINNLSAEMSADAVNIVKGYPRVFINYLKDVIDNINNYINNNKEGSNKEFNDLVKKELFKIIESAKKLLVNIVVYAHLARKHKLENEFCSVLIMMPVSSKYLKRFFEMKLGKIDIDEVKKEINHEEVFGSAPNWLKTYTSELFS